MGKGLSKYIAAFDYFDKTLIVLFVTCGGISTAFFCHYNWCTYRNSKCNFYLTTGVVKNYQKQHGIKRRSIIRLFC